MTYADIWRLLGQLHDADDVVDGQVVQVVDGGLLVDVHGVRAILPLSRITGIWKYGHDDMVVQRALDEMLGTTIRVKLVEVSPPRANSKGRLVLDQKAAQAD